MLFSMESLLHHHHIDSCVHAGTAAECQVERTQYRNKEIAMAVLRSRSVQ